MPTTGPDLFTNGRFDANLDNWSGSAASTVEWVNGRAKTTVLNTSNGRKLFYVPDLQLVAGKRYQIEGNVEIVSGTWSMSFTTISGFFSYGPGDNLLPGIYPISRLSKIAPAAGPGQFYFGCNDIGAVAYFDNLSMREAVQMSNLILTLRDFDGDKKQTSVQLGPVTDGTSYTTRKGEADALETAVNAVAGNIARSQFLANDSEPNNVNAANLSYQTNIRWIVEWVDSVSGDGPYQTDIPTANITGNGLVLAGSVEHDPTATEWVAFKAAFNGKVINPRTGSPVNITRIFLEQ